MENGEALQKLERLARGLARRRGMVSGYVTVSMGAGNPDYFYQIHYLHDGYDANGFAKTGGMLEGCGPTLGAALEKLLPKLSEAERNGA